MLGFPGLVATVFLTGILFEGRMKRSRSSLQARVTRATVFRGKTYEEIRDEIGAVQSIIQRTKRRTLRIRQEDRYSVSLLFDARNLCLAVEEEHD